jgi:hypothetical protein
VVHIGRTPGGYGAGPETSTPPGSFKR